MGAAEALQPAGQVLLTVGVGGDVRRQNRNQARAQAKRPHPVPPILDVCDSRISDIEVTEFGPSEPVLKVEQPIPSIEFRFALSQRQKSLGRKL